MKHKILIFVIASSILLILAVVLIINSPIANMLGDKGQIGDTIGGISAPIVGLLGALLVYLSFIEQTKANKIQIIALKQETNRNNETKEFQSLFDLYKEIKNEYENLTFTSSVARRTKPTVGRRAINNFIEAVKKHHRSKAIYRNGFFRDYLFILSLVSTLIDRVGTSNLSSRDRDLLQKIFIQFYKTKLRLYNERLIFVAKKYKLNHELFVYIEIVQLKIDRLTRVENN